MKRIIAIIDFTVFLFLGAIIAIVAFFTLLIFSFRKRKVYKKGEINRLTFAIFDLTSETYPSLYEEAYLNGYIANEHSLYIDFENPKDRFKKVNSGIYFYSIAAHPTGGFYNMGFRKLNMLMTELRLLAKSFSIAARNNVTFIKTHDPHIIGLSAIIISKIFRLPLALHLNSDFDMKYRGTGKISSPIFINRGVERCFESLVICNSDIVLADREFYKYSRSFPKKSLGKYRTVGVRVDRRHYSDPGSRRDLKRAFGLEGKRILLYVGRLHPVKYPEDAIKAFIEIKRVIENSALLVAGEGFLKESLEELTARHHVRDSILFLGLKSQQELVDIFYTADVLLAPHGGVTLLESALASTPIVAYDFDWHPEFLENGKMGFLVPFRDVKKMAEKTIEILSDEGLKQKMKSYCREIALTRYSREASLNKEKEVYDELLSL